MTTPVGDVTQNPGPVRFPGPYDPLLERLQGNILKGHGRDFTVNLFLHFGEAEPRAVRAELTRLAETYVTSAARQLLEHQQYRDWRLPGGLFGNLFLSHSGYTKRGHGETELRQWFDDPRETDGPKFTNFLTGMKGARADLGDDIVSPAEPLETAYVHGRIDALLLLADDSEEHLLRTVRQEVTALAERGIATVVAVERGAVLRNRQGEGIEHFGYVDGRSQPLFLESDFDGLVDEEVDPSTTKEKLHHGGRGSLQYWNPFASLSLVLTKDRAVADPNAYGSYYVFRKLEQNVQAFAMAEMQLANALGFTGDARERAGAMAVGRFRDGSPLVLSDTDGSSAAAANDFRYDGRNASGATAPGAPDDTFGLKCPFQAHIRKVSPRQLHQDDTELLQRRVVRRGITYGARPDIDGSRGLEGFPTQGVGLHFACFQRSIMRQFGFIQAQWANNRTFPIGGTRHRQTGADAVIGQPLVFEHRRIWEQHWRAEYGGTLPCARPAELKDLCVEASHATAFAFGDFVKFRGGEFFFAPSLPFLLGRSRRRPAP